MKFDDFFAPVLTSFVTVALLVFVFLIHQQGASDSEIAASVSKSVLEFQEQAKIKRSAYLKVRVAEMRSKNEEMQKKMQEAFSKMTPEQQQETLSRMSPKQKEQFLGKKEGTK